MKNQKQNSVSDNVAKTMSEINDLNNQIISPAVGFDNNVINDSESSDSLTNDLLLFNNKTSTVFKLSKEEIKMLKPHHFMDAVPHVNKEQKDSLRDDIQANGFKDAVVITKDKKIVDGRARIELFLEDDNQHELLFSYFDGDSKHLLEFILSKNIFRRNLNQGQKSAGALKLLEIVKKLNKSELSNRMSLIKRNEFDSQENDEGEKTNSRLTVAKYFNVSSSYIGKAKKIYDTNIKNFKSVLKGEISLEEAYKSATQDEQKEFLTLSDFYTHYESENGLLPNLYKNTISFLHSLGLPELSSAQMITKILKNESKKLEKWEKMSPNSKFKFIVNEFLNTIRINLKNDVKKIKEFETKIDKKSMYSEKEQLNTLDERIEKLKSKLDKTELEILQNTIYFINNDNTTIPEEKALLGKIKNFANSVLECENE